ncbi:carboxypeptidase N subunit 2-like isoform X1 [Anopheles merus]|uniref:carboxypeptidase N subunit 2-like isoform X1 n=1 Tax=Anopheles merus TaxID=30066 RepID=UPI001BE3DE47|nr:carboxypeptidase N subunit 2-like isoform X1 [Anopheles merus]
MFSVMNFICSASLLLLVPSYGAAFQFFCHSMTCTITKWSPSEEGSFMLAHIPNDTVLLKLVNLKTNTFHLYTIEWVKISGIGVEVERSSVKKVIMPASDNITRLKLARTYLSDIVFDEGNERLAFLTISDSRLKAVPSTIVHLAALETVEISKSPIETVNMNLFGKLTRLHHINLCDNKILFLHLSDAAGGNFAQLRYLFLSGNLLTAINLSVFNGMTSLQALDLQDNRIRRVQGALVLSTLITFDLSGNRIDMLNCCEWNLTKLTRFTMSHNELSRLPTCLSLAMPNVTYLILDSNALTDDDSWYNIFTLERLQQLDISHNRLTKAVYDTLSPPLGILNLQYNNIKVLSVPIAGKGLKINVSFNSIDTFDIKSLSPNVSSLEMFCNPIDCSFDRERMPIGQEPVCPNVQMRSCDTSK